MSASGSQRPYQGYPYVNPFVVDVPSIDPATAARWTNLPRRPIQLPVSKIRDSTVTSVNTHEGNNEIRNRNASRRAPNRPPLPQKNDPDDNPVIYIDLPEETRNEVQNDDTSDSDEYEDPTSRDRRQNVPRPSIPTKVNTDAAPVVYIDMPEQSGSNVTQNRDRPEEEPAYVQDTIFYDPFENRRIDVVKDEEVARIHGRMEESDEDSVSNRSGTSTIRTLSRPAPPRPSSLSLHSPGTSAASMSPGTSSSTSTPRLPPMMSKEALIYAQNTQDDGFPLYLIPVSEFPKPPPAYTEFDRTTSHHPSMVGQPVSQPDPIPPRTQVILPQETISTPIGMPNLDRKYLNCNYCGMRVHTLVIKENGYITHILAAFCFVLALFPLLCLIYCTDYLKVKNHYCPICSKVIAYELPFTCDKLYFVN